MKKIIALFLAGFASATTYAQEKATLEPSGNIITKEVSVKPFEAIKAKGLYELILSQGDKESVKIEADDNLQYLFSVSNEGSTLVIDMPKLKDQNIQFKKKKEKEDLKLKVYVTFKKINSLDIAVIGSVRSSASLKFDVLNLNSKNVGNVNLEITADKLTLQNKGVGNIRLSGSAANVVITNSGVGEFDGEDLLVQTMDIHNTGVGSANVNVAKDLFIKDSFLGKVTNKGNAKAHNKEGVSM